MDNLQKMLIEMVKKHDFVELQNFIKKNKDYELNFTDNKGRNLLHHAATSVSEKGLPLMQLLLEYIDPLSLNENFESAIDIAKENNNVPGMTLMKFFANKQKEELQSYL